MAATAASGKPQRVRLFAAVLPLALLFVALSAGWLYGRARLGSALDAQAAALRRRGWTVTAEGRRIDGFPFRVRVRQRTLRVVSPGGSGLAADELEAQAYVFAPTHWVFVAPSGLTLLRGAAGPLTVSGGPIRASVAAVGGRPWRLALDAQAVRFQTPPGLKPFSFQGAQRLELYLRPMPGIRDTGQVLFRLTQAQPTSRTLAGALAAGQPVNATVEGMLTRLDAFHGAGWSASARAWSAAGGGFSLHRFDAEGGPTRMWSATGSVGVDADGRLDGRIPVQIRQAVAVEGLAPTAEDGSTGSTVLVFDKGEARLGGIRLGPAPKVG